MARSMMIGPVLAVAIALGTTRADETESQSPINWQADYAKAQQLRQSRGLPLLVFITMDGCPYCQKMLSNTFQDDRIRAHVNQVYVPTFINATRQTELARLFAVRMFPTTFFVSPDNRIVDRIEGYVSPEAFSKRLVQIAQQNERLARSKP